MLGILTRHLSAQGDRQTCLVSCIDDLTDTPQHSRMECLVQIRDVFIHTIDSQCVLDEIIGTNTEKIDLSGQQIGRHTR